MHHGARRYVRELLAGRRVRHHSGAGVEHELPVDRGLGLELDHHPLGRERQRQRDGGLRRRGRGGPATHRDHPGRRAAIRDHPVRRLHVRDRAPNSYSPGPSGGATTIPVSAAAGCPWTAVSNVPWITVPQGAAGTGAGAARLVVESTSGLPGPAACSSPGRPSPSRKEAAAASLSLRWLSRSRRTAAPARRRLNGGGCGWTATSDAPWITLTGPTSGTGGGGIAFTVAALTGAARSGTVSVAGVDITVTQGSGCTFAIAPTSASVPAAAGEAA